MNSPEQPMQQDPGPDDTFRPADLSEAIFSSAGAAIVVIDRQGRIAAFNRRAEEITGFRFSELAGKPVWDHLIPLEVIPKVRAVFDNLMLDRMIGRYENEWLTKDGRRRLFDWRNTVLRDADGAPSHVVAIGDDITERRAAETEARQQTELLRLIIDTAPMRVFWKDRNLTYLGCNPAFARDAGLTSPADLLGKDDYAMGWAEQADLYRADDRLVMESGQPRLHFEEPQTTPDGRTIWLRTSKVPLLDVSGDVFGVLGMYEDITERKQAEAELAKFHDDLEAVIAQRTEQLYDMQFAMDRALIGIHWIDADTGRILYANENGAAMLGYRADELTAMHLADIDADLPACDFRQIYRELFASGQARYERTLRTKQGIAIPVEVVGYRLPEKANQAARLITFNIDISDKQRAAQALIDAKEAAESANLAKSSFLANMSHEIRTPLNAITGLAHLLRRSRLDDSQLEKLTRIETASSHLLGIINDVLDLSKIEADKLSIESVPVSVEALLGNISQMLEPKVRDRGIRLDIETAGITHNLLGDPTRLQQAILNLAANAVKFTHRGRVCLRARVETQTAETATLRFEVEDSGIGIPPEAIPRLFNAFEQGDKSTTRQYGGTGLGLAITRKIAEVLGGSVGVRSIEGQGSTFWFSAVLQKSPVHAVPAPAAGPEDAEARIVFEFAGSRVLVVDDEPVNRMIAEGMCEDVALAVELAENGQEAVQKAETVRYDIILMDMQMPLLNGIDAAMQIRRGTLNAATPIVAMTANAFTEDKVRCLDAGMNDFVTKPVDPKHLYKTLLTWLSHGAAG